MAVEICQRDRTHGETNLGERSAAEEERGQGIRTNEEESWGEWHKPDAAKTDELSTATDATEE